jgi:Nucleotidyl transferase AbiEii toxin, Type IV TA system
MGFEQAASTVASDLDQLGLRYALIGGFAVSIRTDPRFTQDIDLVVAVSDDAAAELAVRRVVERGYAILAVVEHEAQNRLATVRLELPGEAWVVDLLFASSGIEAEIVHAADRVEVVRGLWLPVASVGHLIALKLLARDDDARPQDWADLRALVGVASKEELLQARDAVGLIEARGYARGRDLGADLRVVLADTNG